MTAVTKPKTYVTIVLDKSGSMGGTKVATIQGFNEQVQQIKENAKNQDIFASLVTFNGEVFENLWCVEAANLQEATVADYHCNGSTAMRDAIGYTIDKLQNTVEDDENTAYLMIIISDGEENSSVHVSVDSLRERIDACQATKRWTFTYMGCNADYLKKVAKETNIPISNMAIWNNADEENVAFAFAKSKKSMGNYYRSREVNEVPVSCLYACSADSFGDFTKEGDSNNIANPVILHDQQKPVTLQAGPSLNADEILAKAGIFGSGKAVDFAKK